LREIKSTFCTLYLFKELRGCIGTLQATRELVVDVSKNAYSAAFNDSRFQPLSKSEYQDTTIHLSVLSVPQPLLLKNESKLLQELEKSKQGVVIRHNNLSATFLPSVWKSLPDVNEFIYHLKSKAGISQSIAFNDLEYLIYSVEEFGDNL